MMEHLQPNLGAFAGLNEVTAATAERFAGIGKAMEHLQPNLGAFAGLNEVTAATAERFAGIGKAMEQLQPNLGAFAGLNEVTAATAEAFAGIERAMEQLQPNLEAFAGIGKAMEQLQPGLEAFAGLNEVTAATAEAFAGLNKVTAATAERFAGIGRAMEQLQPNLGAFAGQEGPVHATGDPTGSVTPPLSPADQEDAPEGVLEVATVKLLKRLMTWCDLCDVLVGIEGLEEARLEVARQIDECLSRIARTADSDRVCWHCGGAALMFYGVTCAECAVLVGRMMLETVFLAEEL